PTTEKSGASFIRTDQLDGETDWKLRRAVNSTQKLATDDALLNIRSSIYGAHLMAVTARGKTTHSSSGLPTAEKPKKDIYSFIGNFTRIGGDSLKVRWSLAGLRWFLD